MNHFSHYQKEYPRPQFVREQWMNLNGEWQFAFDDENTGVQDGWFCDLPRTRPITVPFAYQTKASGIGLDEYHKVLWYRREISLPRAEKKRTILHFEGADWCTDVWVNGVYIGHHEGGYCRFSMDVTDALKRGPNASDTVCVRCEDDNACTKPRGKQSWMGQPFGCWYPPTSGIWKTVWAETVSPTHLSRVKLTPIADTYHMLFEYEVEGLTPGCMLTTVVRYGENRIAKQSMELVRENHTYSLDLSNDLDGFKIHWWTPECPNLYEIDLTLTAPDGTVLDTVYTYGAFRLFQTCGNKLMLNLNPVYLRMVLEQAYWRTSGLTAPDEEALMHEIAMAKDLGFNGMRMHQKIEDERFYYYADVMGMMIFCEMPSAYEFKEQSVSRITREWMEAVGQNYNHPSIVAWVPINESWGVNRLTASPTEAQFTQALYHLTKAYDPMRPVIGNDGWEHTEGDIISFHNYCQEPKELERFFSDVEAVVRGDNRTDYSNLRVPFVQGHGYHGQPILIDEFAGIGLQIHDKGWGYGNNVANTEQFLNRLRELIRVIVSHHEFAGFCITQLTDVYQEINGLYDFDRVPKAESAALREAITMK